MYEVSSGDVMMTSNYLVSYVRMNEIFLRDIVICEVGREGRRVGGRERLLDHHSSKVT